MLCISHNSNLFLVCRWLKRLNIEIFMHIIFQLSKTLITFCSFQDEVQETLDKTKESCNEEVTKLEEKADEVKAQMSDLKTHLYAKFGNAINLENDE